MTDKQMGKLIKEIRKEKNITIEELARGICDESTLSYFEKGKRRLDNLLLHRIFDRIGIEADEFALMVDEEEYEYHLWKEQAIEAVEEKAWDRLEELLDNKDVALNIQYNKKIQYQTYYKLKGIWQAEKNHNRKAAVGYLQKAISLTMPNVLTMEWEKLCMGEQELHLLMLYLYYGTKEGRIKKVEQTKLYEKLEDYISEKHMEAKKQAKLCPKLVCIWLNITEVSFPQRKVLCEKAIQILRETRRLHDITEILRLYVEILEERQDEKVVFYRKHLENFSDIFGEAGIESGFQPEVLAGRREKLFLITEYLVSERVRKGMTQQEVSADICEPETYSRIETGKRTPKKSNMYELVERLGIPWCYYRGELELDSLKAYRMWQEVKRSSNRGYYEDVIYLLDKLQRYIDMESNVNSQYIGFEENIAKRGLELVTSSEAFVIDEELFKKTKLLTVENLFQYYSQTEMEIMAHMGRMLYIQKKYKEGILLLENVLKNQKQSRVIWEYQWHGIDYVLRMLSDLYFGIEGYEEANSIQMYVLKMNLRQQEAISLPQSLDAIADNYEHIGKQYSKKYKELYRQTYYVADFFQFEKIVTFAKKYYEDNFEKEMKWY